MSNNFYNATGALVLDAVTPVIRALFNGFKLDSRAAATGQAYIAKQWDVSKPQWEDVQSELVALCEELGLPIAGDFETLEACLSALGKKFDVDRDETLLHFIESHPFDGDADLQTLFELAIRFDDGHGLKALVFEGGWHSDCPDLFEFGGEGHFLSNQFAQTSNSHDIITFGEKLREKLSSGDLDGCTKLFDGELTRLLDGIRNASQRIEIRERLGMLLADEYGYVPF
jgi:hypothetical protein